MSIASHLLRRWSSSNLPADRLRLEQQPSLSTQEELRTEFEAFGTVRSEEVVAKACRLLSCAARIIVLSTALWLVLLSPGRAAGVFSTFAGYWRGQGSVSLTDGSRESIRCKAAYGVRSDGAALSVDVDCASDSYRVHIVANVVAQNTAFAGSWQETTREVSGTVTGRVPAQGEMQATFDTMGGGLQLAARIDKRRQVVNITSQGSDIQAVRISLSR